MRSLAIVALLAHAVHVSARSVFAHFMWEHATTWSVDRWKTEIKVAQDMHIEAFAMNAAYKAGVNPDAMSNAFAAADNLGFKLFLSLDYAGNGLWPRDVAQNWIQWANARPAVFRYNGKPLVSTFEGWEAAGDFVSIKANTGIFFCPDWSSRGAQAAAQLNGGVADCLFSWAAWPEGKNGVERIAVEDASYRAALGSKPFMMPVSPWFYTNLPGYGKNWLWKGNSLWLDRWQQILALPTNQVPEFIQIISWNDFGESHYIGPRDSGGYPPFQYGAAPYNYAQDMSHDYWRAFLPVVIDLFKNRQHTVRDEGITVWYRETMGRTCGTGGTTGNAPYQTTYAPYDILEDNIYVAVECATKCILKYRINGVESQLNWRVVPANNVGIYQGQIPITSSMVDKSLSFSLIRDTGAVVMTLDAAGRIKNTCVNGITNWNPRVEGKMQTSGSTNPVIKI